MLFVILRLLKHNELGVFHSYRRQGKERAKQRAINFDGDVVDRVFPAAKDSDIVVMTLRYEIDKGIAEKDQWLKRQSKNWRLEGNCPQDHCYDFVDPGCLFAMVVDAGVRPASGAWAVYPADHHVTRAIQANAESSTLTSRSMIALHDEEGFRTLSLLRQSKPELFGVEGLTEADTARTTATTLTGNGVHLPPNPKRLVKILASVGHTLPSAVADIVDNAISKDATEIHITFGRPDDGHGRWMTIIDNGIGMDEKRLAEAMRIGSDSDYEAQDLGKYGYGLKGASWSQTNCFTVVTKQAGQPTSHLTWDAETMDSWEAQRGPLENWVADETKIDNHGTCVFWRSMRPPKAIPTAKGIDPHTAEVLNLHRHLGLVFHRFLDGKVTGRKRVIIKINDVAVESNDPVGHGKVQAYDRKTIRVPTATKDALVHVQAFLLPSEAEIKELHGDDSEAARRDLDRIGMYGRRNESQGVYVYRNQRLIQWGGWHQMWATTDEKTKLARVTVDFGTDLDDQFSVNISKRLVTLSQQLQEETKKLAEAARSDSKRKYLDHDSPKKIKTKNAIQPPVGTSPTAKTGAASALPFGGPPQRSGGTAKLTVPVRPVKTESFIWKIAKNMMGGQEIQINEQESDLHGLLLAVANDSAAMSSLTGFLARLDDAGVQSVLMAAKNDS